jgi:hypothetical protein
VIRRIRGVSAAVATTSPRCRVGGSVTSGQRTGAQPPTSEQNRGVAIGVFDLFSIGIGPSSSHTVGPMRAAHTFVTGLANDGLLETVTSVRVELFGSLGATGHGHGSEPAVLLGLAGEQPETVVTATMKERATAMRAAEEVPLLGKRPARLGPDDLVLHRRESLPYHPNGMKFFAFDATGAMVRERTYYSVGGGFVVDEAAAGADRITLDATVLPYPFTTGAELMAGAPSRACRCPRSCWPTSSPGAPRPRSIRACCTSGRSCRSA